jgi:uncharacterized protein (TIGR02466 family)
MNIDNIFYTPIAYSFYPKHKDIRDELINHCYDVKSKIESGGKNWLSKNVYTTCGTHNIYKDEKFKLLNNWIYSQVTEFKNTLGYSKELKEEWAWLNLYNKSNFQEYHNHNFQCISAIYYLKANKNDGRTFFKSPLPANPNTPNLDSNNPYTWSSYFTIPEEGKLVMFKSSLEHCVEAQPTNNIRITLAYNYDI